MWVVRVWEEQAPDGEESLEWILMTSVPTTTLEQIWKRVEWYQCRWFVETIINVSKAAVALRSDNCKR